MKLVQLLLVGAVFVVMAADVQARPGPKENPVHERATEQQGGSMQHGAKRIADEVVDATVDELVGEEKHHEGHGSGTPPGLSKKDKMPPGLEKQGKVPAGWSKGEKKGWDDKAEHAKESKEGEEGGAIRRLMRGIFGGGHSKESP